jgi:hypothetical protein
MFIPVNNLEKSLIRAAGNPAGRPQFYRDLLEADIFVVNAGETHLDIQNNVLQKGAQLNLQTLERDGIAWVPVFSSLQRLQQFLKSDSGYLRLKAKDFFEITRGAHVLLNPNLEYGKEFTPQEIERLLDGSIFKASQRYVAEKDTKVLLGQPAVYPKELVKVLAGYFATKPQVKRAYLAQFFNPEKDEKPHVLIGIDVQGDWEKVTGEAGMITAEVMGRGEVVDIIRLDDSGISEYMINQTRPFYRKPMIKKLFG